VISPAAHRARIELRKARERYAESVPGTIEHSIATLLYGAAIRDLEARTRFTAIPSLWRRQA
jgi:hypothetical protein